MKKLMLALAVAVALLAVLISSVGAAADSPNGPPVKDDVRPPHHEYFVAPLGKQITGSTSYYEPKQVKNAYGFGTGDGTGQTIAIVDAYDDPNALNDLNVFSQNFGLPLMTNNLNFRKIYAQSSRTRTNSGWALEISLDLQWAHAIAPRANILLVEASNASYTNLLQAVDVAVKNGANVVSMSWGGNETSTETSYDFHFNKPGVTFVAASGDSGSGVIYPAVSPYVLSVGGTTLHLDLNGNVLGSETAWSGSGGGISSVEAEPGYQTSYSISTGGKRGNPDVAYDADPNTGFLVYDSVPYYGQAGWWSVGGTSAGSPQWAALIALANQSRAAVSKGPLASNNLTSSPEYSAATGAIVYSSDYTDIQSGSNGLPAGPGYDLVTGLGSPKAGGLVAYLTSY